MAIRRRVSGFVSSMSVYGGKQDDLNGGVFLLGLVTNGMRSINYLSHKSACKVRDMLLKAYPLKDFPPEE